MVLVRNIVVNMFSMLKTQKDIQLLLCLINMLSYELEKKQKSTLAVGDPVVGIHNAQLHHIHTLTIVKKRRNAKNKDTCHEKSKKPRYGGHLPCPELVHEWWSVKKLVYLALERRLKYSFLGQGEWLGDDSTLHD